MIHVHYGRLDGTKVIEFPSMDDMIQFFGDGYKADAYWQSPGRQIGLDVLGDPAISTVFVPLVVSLASDAPLWFESAIFGGVFDGYRKRYATYAEAQVGHILLVEKVRKGENPYA